VPDPDTPATSGHPRWYGARFALREPATWGEPDETHTLTLPRTAGEPYRAEIQAWHNLLMRGKRKPTPLPMHRYPFTLVRVQLYRADGRPVYRNPLWFIIIGQRRAEITVPDAYLAYRQRFDIEHAYRFCKQRMLLTRYQTPKTDHEQVWWRLVHLAYLQLWVAQPVAQRLPRPWERYLPTGTLRPRCRRHSCSATSPALFARLAPPPNRPNGGVIPQGGFRGWTTRNGNGKPSS